MEILVIQNSLESQEDIQPREKNVVEFHMHREGNYLTVLNPLDLEEYQKESN